MTTEPNKIINDILAKVPPDQLEVAKSLLAEYGPRLVQMTREDALAYYRRIMAGDIQAVADLDAKLSDAEWIAKVKANTAAWETVANYNKVRDDLRKEALLRIAPIVLTILAGFLGL